MVPGTLPRALGLAPDVVIVRGDGGRYFLEYTHGVRGERRVSAPIDDIESPQLPAELDRILDGAPREHVRVELQLDHGAAIARTVRVPRAAEKELAGVLSFEVERHTPYRAGEVLFVYRINDAAGDAETLAVDLDIVPRKTVDDIVECLSKHGLSPEVIRVAAADGGAHMLVGAGPETASKPAGRPLRVAAAAAAVLAVVAIASPLLRLHATAAHLRTEIAATRERASTTLTLRDDVSRIQATTRQIVEAKRQSASAVRILEGLSKLLPDGTWLHQVSLVGDEIILEGNTASSADLVKVLESSSLFGAVSYVSPVTREPGKNVENFSFSIKRKVGAK